MEIQIVEILLRHPQTFVNTLDSNSETALEKAIGCNHHKVSELLLRCPKIEGYTDVNPLNFENQSVILGKGLTCCVNASAVLIAASLKNDFRAIRGLLLCPDIDINTKNRRGKTPIYLASWRGHLESVKVLVNDSELDVNKGSNKDGKTAFRCCL